MPICFSGLDGFFIFIMSENKFIAHLESTGICELNIQAIIKDGKTRISSYGDSVTAYRKVKGNTKYNFKCKVSEAQANEIIQGLNLVAVKSPVFKRATTYYSLADIEVQKQNIEQQIEENEAEIKRLAEKAIWLSNTYHSVCSAALKKQNTLILESH